MSLKRLLLLCVLFVCLPCLAGRTITDELGRRVRVPDHPHRLICLIPSVADDIYALGAGVDVVGVSDFTKYPAEAASKPSIGLPMTPSIETILSLHPDLVIGSGSLNDVQNANELTRLGIPVFMLDPHGIAGIYRSIQDLGHALNREAAASVLVVRLRAREAAVRRRVRGKPVARIFMPIWYDPVITVGKNAFITELIAAAGGRSVTGDIRQEWPQVSLEAIISRAPEALVLVKGSHMSLADIAHRPGWDELAAVKAGRVYYVDDKIDYPSPVAFNALEELAEQFHP